MIKTKKILLWFTCASLSFLSACSEPQPQSPTENTASDIEAAEISSLRAQLTSLKGRAQRVKDGNDIKRLQRAYGYYVDEALWGEVAELFADNATLEIGLDGVYRGKARIREYLYRFGGGQDGLSAGQLNEHFQLMPVVTLADDGMTAQARWRAIILGGQFGESAVWGEGPYENEYVKENGVWKISKLHWYQTIMVPYEGGWAANVDVNGGKYVSGEFPPDEPSSMEYETWPGTFMPPYHFSNPVNTYHASEATGGAQ